MSQTKHIKQQIIKADNKVIAGSNANIVHISTVQCNSHYITTTTNATTNSTGLIILAALATI